MDPSNDGDEAPLSAIPDMPLWRTSRLVVGNSPVLCNTQPAATWGTPRLCFHALAEASE